MKRKGFWAAGLAGVFPLILCAAAPAQYRPPTRSEPEKTDRDSFQEAVDLKRFRKGNDVWDTQALVSSGLTALHEEHLQILRELEALRAELKQLKEHRE